MTLREMMSPDDINFGAWREIYARGLANDIVLNGISPAFGLDNQWSYIEDSGLTLFENAAMSSRYKKSAAAYSAIAHVREARADLGEHSDFATAALDAHMYESVEYAQSYLLLTDNVMCSTMEHTNDTVASYPALYTRVLSPDVDWRRKFGETFHAFAKVCFDLLYGAHCLHTKAHLVHADLHGNNMTLHRFSTPYRVVDGKEVLMPGVDNPVVAYVLGRHGDSSTYVFPFDGLTGTIIDFSRAIFGPRMAEDRRRPDAGDEKFTTDFFRNQVSRTMRAFHRYAPVLAEKNQEKLKAAILARPGQAFRVLSYVDFVAVGAAMSAMLTGYKAEKGDLRAWAPPADMAAFAKKVERAARADLTTFLMDLLEPGANSKSAEIPFAGERLLPQLFADFKWGAARSKGSAAEASEDKNDAAATKSSAAEASAASSKGSSNSAARAPMLCDLYNYNNAMTWSGRDPAWFPPWAQLKQLEAHSAGLKVRDILRRDVEPFLESLAPKVRVQVLAEQTRAEQSALDKPASATSSWL